VWARSKPGQGTTFVLRLRRLDAERLDAGKLDTGKLDAGKLDKGKLDAERQATRATSAESFAAPTLQSAVPGHLAAAAAEGRLRG